MMELMATSTAPAGRVQRPEPQQLKDRIDAEFQDDVPIINITIELAMLLLFTRRQR